MSKELTKTTGTVGGMTFISRVLGFIRDMVIARIFGTGVEAEAFFVAFKLPNLFRRLFAEGAFAQAFIPVLAEYHRNRDLKSMQIFVACTAGNLGFALLLFTAFGILVAPLFIFIFAPGFIDNHTQFTLASELLRITFPYLMFVSLTSFMGSVLNVYGVFWVPAIAPVLLNVALILCALYLAPFLGKPITALAWGVALGGVLQFVAQFPSLGRLKLLPRFRIHWQHEGVQRVLKLMLPATLGVSVAQINLAIDTWIASWLEKGSIAWIYYSDRIMEFPLGVFGIALSTTILPHLSRKNLSQDPHQFSQLLDWGIRTVLLIAIPATLGLIFLAEPVLITLFRHGKFSAHDVSMTAKSLIFYVSGLVAFILVKIFAGAYYAKQDTTTPMRIAVITLVANIGFNLLFIKVFNFSYVGLALATSLAGFLNATLLFYHLYRDKIYQPMHGFWVFLTRIVLSNLAMVYAVIWFTPSVSTWLAWQWHLQWVYLSLIILLAMVVYFGTLFLFGMRSRHFKSNLAT